MATITDVVHTPEGVLEVLQKGERRAAHALGFLLIAGLLGAIVVTAPIALISLAQEFLRQAQESGFTISPPDMQPATSYSRLELDVLSLDEVQRLVTIRVTGHHVCNGCQYKDKVTFYSLPVDGEKAEGVPPSESVILPAASDEVSARFTLPIHGRLMQYPFDSWQLWLGVTMQRVLPDGSFQPLVGKDAEGHLFVTATQQVARAHMLAPRVLDPLSVQPEKAHIDFLYTHAMTFQRPAYLKVIVMMVVLLMTAVSFYTVLVRPFDQLIMNTGAIVLGVWGLRTLLLGGYPPDVTAVDIALTCLIFTSLCIIGIRTLGHLHESAGLNIIKKSKKENAA